MPKFALGCPVADRAWVLPDWFERLQAQTLRPDVLLFVHSGVPGDETWRMLRHEAERLGVPVMLDADNGRGHAREDNARFRTLARLRNRLLDAAGCVSADVLVSLDSDVLLGAPDSLERLVDAVVVQDWDTASLLTWLHPDGPGSWAWNAGWWVGEPQEEGMRSWTRGARESIAWGQTLSIDIPMAATAIGPRALRHCRYAWHESGEDLGFALDLERSLARCAWITDLEAVHVWEPAALERARRQVSEMIGAPA